MHRANVRGWACLALAAAVPAATIGCERPIEARPGHPAQAAMRVDAVRPERQTVRRSVGEPGQLVAAETTHIQARVSGYVQAVKVDIGDEVKRGQLLAELSAPELVAEHRQKLAAVEQARAAKLQADAAVEVARASLASAGARLAESRAGVNRVDADLARWRSETERVSALVSDRAATGSLLDETRSKLRSSESSRDEMLAHVQSGEAGLAEGRAGLDRARSDVAAAAGIEFAAEDARRLEAMLGYTRITAPYDGVITRRDVDTGQLTKPGLDGTPLFVVARTDVVTVVLDVPETYATDAGPGDRVLVKLQALKGRAVEGRVTRTSWALDPRTRTIRVEVDLPNPGGMLRPGLYAYATVVVEEHPDVLTLPATSIVLEKDKAFCVCVDGGRARRRPIETGIGDGTRTEVLSGLSGDELVVKAGAASIAEDQPVEVAGPQPAKP